MFPFVFHNPVKIFFGPGEVRRIAAEIPATARVLIVLGKGSAARNGALEQVRSALAGRPVVELTGVEPNPAYETLTAALPLMRRERIDFLLAVGGGSVIDGTKFLAAAACFDGDPWDFLTARAKVAAALSFAAVLTLPAAGSEMNCYAVISRLDRQEKRSFDSPLLYPRFSVLDPTFTTTLPPRQTANGIVDTFVHVIEQYLTYPVNAPLQDRLAEGILQTLREEGPKALRDPADLEARANLMWCSTLALNELISAGVPSDWTTHEIGHFLTALYGIDHARTLSVLLPAVLAHQRRKKSAKLRGYGARVFGLDGAAGGDLELAAIERTRAFFAGLGVETRLRDHGLTEGDLPAVLRRIEAAGILPLGEHKDVDLDGVRSILGASL